MDPDYLLKASNFFDESKFFIAFITIVLTQLWIDKRQYDDHERDDGIRKRDHQLQQKEKLIDLFGDQIKSISHVEDIFHSWAEDFDNNYSPIYVNNILREIDVRLKKIRLIVKLNFPDLLNSFDGLDERDEIFRCLCADYVMGGRFGRDDFMKVYDIDISDASNAYAVSYIFLSEKLIDS